MCHCYKGILLKADRGDIPTVHLNKHMVKFRQLDIINYCLIYGTSCVLITFEYIELENGWYPYGISVWPNIHWKWALLKFIFFICSAWLYCIICDLPYSRYNLLILPKTNTINVKMLHAYVCIYPHKCVNKKTIWKNSRLCFKNQVLQALINFKCILAFQWFPGWPFKSYILM